MATILALWSSLLLVIPLSCALLVGYGREVPIPAGTRARYQYHNHAGEGSYKFGYDTGSGPGQSFRQEEREKNGTVRGRYGYMDPRGTLRVVEYRADAKGFHVLRTSAATPEPPPRPRPVFRPPSPFVGPLPPFLRSISLNALYANQL